MYKKKQKFLSGNKNSLLRLVLSDGNIDKPIPWEGHTPFGWWWYTSYYPDQLFDPIFLLVCFSFPKSGSYMCHLYCHLMTMWMTHIRTWFRERKEKPEEKLDRTEWLCMMKWMLLMKLANAIITIRMPAPIPSISSI